jgi:hypothetical protein
MGLAAALVFGQKKKSHTMTITASGACPNDKCCLKKACTDNNYTKPAHFTSYNRLQLLFTGVLKLRGDLVACSKKYAVAAASKEKNGRDKVPSWDHDAKTAEWSNINFNSHGLVDNTTPSLCYLLRQRQ